MHYDVWSYHNAASEVLVDTLLQVLRNLREMWIQVEFHNHRAWNMP